MNKKLLLISITASSLCLLLVLVVVLLVNKDATKPNVSNKPDTSNVSVSSSNREEVYTDSKSFLNDETFLDEEQPALKPKDEQKKKEVKLLVSSVSKDIRVTVTDKYGNKDLAAIRNGLVKGELKPQWRDWTHIRFKCGNHYLLCEIKGINIYRGHDIFCIKLGKVESSEK